MSHSKKVYLYISILIIISIIFIVFLIQPIIKSIINKSAEFEVAKMKLNSINLLAESFSDFEKNYDYYGEFLEEMEDILTGESAIDPEIPISFISFFKQEAEELSLVLKVVPIETKETDDFWTFLDFRIEGTGEYNDFKQFLQKLEFGHWFVEVKGLNIRKEEISKYIQEQEELANRNLIQFDLFIRIYAQEKD